MLLRIILPSTSGVLRFPRRSDRPRLVRGVRDRTREQPSTRDPAPLLADPILRLSLPQDGAFRGWRRGAPGQRVVWSFVRPPSVSRFAFWERSTGDHQRERVQHPGLVELDPLRLRTTRRGGCFPLEEERPGSPFGAPLEIGRHRPRGGGRDRKSFGIPVVLQADGCSGVGTLARRVYVGRVGGLGDFTATASHA